MPQLDQFTYFTQFFWSCLFFFTFYILICNDRDGILGISRILKLRNKLLSHRGNKIQSKDPKSLEDILRKGFNTGVSYMYSSLFEVSQWCKAAQVKISESKSLRSKSGSLEFAKQFWVDGVRKNLSPISAKARSKSYTTLGILQLYQKYPVSEKTCLRLSGAGYRVLGSLDQPILSSRRYQKIRALCTSTKQLHNGRMYPLEWWIGRGSPLSPYTRGEVIDFFRREVDNKDISLLPGDRYSGDGEIWQVENTLIRNHMKLWLKYLHWFIQIQTDPNVQLEDFFGGPVVSSSPYIDFSPHFRVVVQTWSCLYLSYDKFQGRTPGYYRNVLTDRTTVNWGLTLDPHIRIFRLWVTQTKPLPVITPYW